MNKKMLIPLVALILLALVLWGAPKINDAIPRPPTATPKPTEQAYVAAKVLGGLIFQDSEVIKYFHDNYRIDIQETMMGSYAQAEADLKGLDCVHPASASAVDYFNSLEKNKGKALRTDTVFQTYIVVYTWKQYIPALEKAGLVYQKDGTAVLKMRPIIDAMIQNKMWSDLNVNIPGPVNIESTDPLKSASGLVFTTIIADYLIPGGENGGKVVTESDVSQTLSGLHTYWEKQGRQMDNSPALFTKFIRSGSGLPMVANYESAFVQLVSSLPADQKSQADKIVGLYPEVTVNTDHVLISLTPTCNRIAEILQTDTWIKQLAWSKLGMRNGQGGIEAKPGEAQIPWIAASVQAMPEPKKSAVDALKAAFQ